MIIVSCKCVNISSFDETVECNNPTAVEVYRAIFVNEAVLFNFLSSLSIVFVSVPLDKKLIKLHLFYPQFSVSHLL